MVRLFVFEVAAVHALEAAVGGAVKTSLPRIDFTENDVFNWNASQQDLFPQNEDGSNRTVFRNEKISAENPDSDGFKAVQDALQTLVPSFKRLPIEKMGDSNEK